MNAPALSALFLHGVGSSSDTWWRVREDLADLGWETQAIDLAGHGDRPLPARGLRSVADLSEDVWEQVADQAFDVLVGVNLLREGLDLPEVFHRA